MGARARKDRSRVHGTPRLRGSAWPVDFGRTISGAGHRAGVFGAAMHRKRASPGPKVLHVVAWRGTMVRPNVATRRRPTGSVGAEARTAPGSGADVRRQGRSHDEAPNPTVRHPRGRGSPGNGHRDRLRVHGPDRRVDHRERQTCEPFTLIATVVDAAGAPVVGQSVAWAFVTSPSASDVISPTPTITDLNGKATTTVTFGSASGTREIRATAGSVSASAVIDPAKCEWLGRGGGRHARTGRPAQHVDAPCRILRGHPDRGAVPRRRLRARRRPGAAPPGRGDTQLRSGPGGSSAAIW